MKSSTLALVTRNSLVTSLLTASVTLLGACGNQADSKETAPKNAASAAANELSGRKPKAKPNLAQLAASVPELSTLVKLVTLCDLGTALTDATASLTVFAPTNAAFDKYLNGAAFPEKCSDEIKSTLVYHIIPAKVLSQDLAERQAVPSLLGAKDELFVTKKEGVVQVNGTSKVVLADAMASNGVAHLVDTVLVTDAMGTVVDAAIKRYELSTLVSAVVGAGLAETLATTENITVFAPVNAAFAELAAVPSGDALVRVLTNHVLGTRVLASQLKLGFQSVKALNNEEIAISLSDAGAKIWGSGQTEETSGKIIQTDINTKNGVIHAVSKVLLPK